MPNEPVGATTEPVVDSPSVESPVSAQVAEGVPQDAGVVPSEEAPATKAYDWYDTSTWGERKPADVMKEVQAHLNKLSETKKGYETELEQERQAKQQLVAEAQQVLRDEKLYRLYQQKLGIAPQSVEPTSPPQSAVNQLPAVELSPDMTIDEAQNRFNQALKARDEFYSTHTKEAVNDAISHFKQELYKELNQSLAPMHKSKWKSAMDQATDRYGPAFMEARNKVVAMIDGPYAHLYNGENEADLIDTVFRAACPDEYNKYVISSFQKKNETIAQASTATAARSVQTLPTDNSVESCVKRANAKAEARLRARGLL